MTARIHTVNLHVETSVDDDAMKELRALLDQLEVAADRLAELSDDPPENVTLVRMPSADITVNMQAATVSRWSVAHWLRQKYRAARRWWRRRRGRPAS